MIEIMRKMREDRGGAIQSEDQLEYSYNCLVRWVRNHKLTTGLSEATQSLKPELLETIKGRAECLVKESDETGLDGEADKAKLPAVESDSNFGFKE